MRSGLEAAVREAEAEDLALRLETGSYRGGREAVCSRLASNTASLAAASPRPPPSSCSGPELHESLGQTILYTEIDLTGEMVSVVLGEVATLSYLDRKLCGGTTHFTAFLHHICIKCLQ